jgi:hypothetical protein
MRSSESLSEGFTASSSALANERAAAEAESLSVQFER